MSDPRKDELEKIIEQGKIKVPNVLNEIKTEFDNRSDFIIKPDALTFDIETMQRGMPQEHRTIVAKVKDPKEEDFGIKHLGYDFTNHARNQLLAKCGIPVTYADRLLQLGEDQLLKETLEKLNGRLNEDGLLFRVIFSSNFNNRPNTRGLSKGILSPSYKIIDGSPLCIGFVEACIQAGYVPYNGCVSDYRYNISFILPEIFQPSENEFLVMGISLTTGDYGASALHVELTIVRITCRNLMRGLERMRKIHMGRRFQTDDDYSFISNETHRLDNLTTTSAIQDVVKDSIDMQTAVKEKLVEAINSEKALDINAEIGKLRKKGYSKELVESVKNMYNSEGMPVEMLPKEKGVWRLSNVLSLIANGDVTKDTALDLQRESMSLL
mgnify:CR=1 FL=1